MIQCNCKDCLDTFYSTGSQAYTDNHCLNHHTKCNHITQKEFHRIEFEQEVWLDDLGIYVTEMVTHWTGYRCTCIQEYQKEKEEQE